MKELDYIFNPRSVAVVGVSENPNKLASVFFNNLIKGGFEGNLYPVNPKYNELYDYKSYANVSDIPEDVDQVAILIPARFVIDVMKDCAKKGVKSVLIVSAGFGEMGEEGKALEKEILDIAQSSGIRVVGPNIIGVLSPLNNLNSSWASALPQPGNVAFVSQSGAFCTAVLDIALNRNLGFSHFVSVGNRIDVDEIELFKYWNEDENVKVIGAYIEEIKYGQELMKLVNSKESNKPIIIYKPGKTEEAKKAISSHTGSMAGSVETVHTAINQSGIVEANNPRELFNSFMTFSWSKKTKGNRVAVITNAGGPGIMATDAIVESGLQIAKLSEETQKAISEALPDAASEHNPVDVLGDALADRYQVVTDILLKDENVDMILYVLTPQYITQIEETAQVVIDAKNNGDKPVFAAFLGEKTVNSGLQKMYSDKVPAFAEIIDAVKSMATLFNYSEYEREKNSTDNSEKSNILSFAGKGVYRNEVKDYLEKGTKVLPDDLVDKILEEIELDTPKQIVTANIDEALESFADKYPVAVKAPNNAIPHKTDLKAVYLGIKDETDLREKFALVADVIRKETGNDNPEVMVQEMINSENWVLVGANRDGGADVYEEGTSGFGHLIVFGQGGIYTEVYNDIGYALVPAGKKDIEEEFYKTKISKILKGVRGQEEQAHQEVITAIQKIQKLVVLYPEIASLDINPFIVTKDRVCAVDVKVFIGK